MTAFAATMFNISQVGPKKLHSHRTISFQEHESSLKCIRDLVITLLGSNRLINLWNMKRFNMARAEAYVSGAGNGRICMPLSSSHTMFDHTQTLYQSHGAIEYKTLDVPYHKVEVVSLVLSLSG